IGDICARELERPPVIVAAAGVELRGMVRESEQMFLQELIEAGQRRIELFLVQAGKRIGKEMIIGHRAKSPTVCSTILPLPISAVFYQPRRRGRPVLGGKGPAAGSHGEGTERRGQAPGICPLSAKQIAMRQAASVRVKQSKSQQIVANAYTSS